MLVFVWSNITAREVQLLVAADSFTFSLHPTTAFILHFAGRIPPPTTSPPVEVPPSSTASFPQPPPTSTGVLFAVMAY